jgi:hypothetical protein
MKTISVSLTSSMCTALFVVACTAGAEKPSETSTEDGEWGSDADDDGGPGGDDGSSDGLTSAEMSDCVLREIASWQGSVEWNGVVELDGIIYEVDAPTCALQVAYAICGDGSGISEYCLDY